MGMAEKNDVVLLLGKGHETYQILKDKTIHYDEREIVKEVVKRIGIWNGGFKNACKYWKHFCFGYS